jgi:hypothetical protein
MGHMACTEPQCLYKGALYLYFYYESEVIFIRILRIVTYLCNTNLNITGEKSNYFSWIFVLLPHVARISRYSAVTVPGYMTKRTDF